MKSSIFYGITFRVLVEKSEGKFRRSWDDNIEMDLKVWNWGDMD
jgi:hypothetical protein